MLVVLSWSIWGPCFHKINGSSMYIACEIMYHFSADIRIGFSEPLYQFREPEAANVTTNLILVKNRRSEQTFLVSS